MGHVEGDEKVDSADEMKLGKRENLEKSPKNHTAHHNSPPDNTETRSRDPSMHRKAI